MTPARLIVDLAKAGITLAVRGDKLIVNGPQHLLTEHVLRQLKTHKAAIMPLVKVDWARRTAYLLNKVNDPDRRADLREQFEERAAIAEIDGGLPRDEAERIGYEQIRHEIESGVGHV